MNKLNIIAFGIAVLIGIIGLSAYLQTRPQKSDPLPKFSFDQSKASGWWGRDSINVQEVARTTNYTGNEPIEKLPVADTTIFHGTTEQAAADGCFVSYSYYDYALEDEKAAYDSYFGDKASEGKLESFAPIKLSLSTFEGNKEYDLQQYRFVIEGQNNLQGYQVGFIPLASGYVRTEGVCKTYEELAQILPVMGSVRLMQP